MSFGWMDNPINPAPVWYMNLNQPIQPGQSLTVTTPIFDVPIPSNATEWPFWDELTGPNGWPNSNYGPLMLYLNSCYISSVTVNSFLPQSDDCPNINEDQFCDCDIEVYDFRTTPEMEMDLIIKSDYNCFPSSYPPGTNSFNLNNPYINNITIGVSTLPEDNCAPPSFGYNFLHFTSQQIPDYILGDTITLQLDQASNWNLSTCLIESFENGDYNDCYTAVLWQINNSFNFLSAASPDVTPNDNFISVDSGCGVVNDIPDLSIESFDYSVIGCDVGSPYASTQITVTNEGNTVINSFCINFDILNDGILGIQNCFENLNLLPGESYVVYIDGEVMANGVTSIFITTPNETTTSNNFIVEIIDLPCYGCINTGAINYDPFATVDDGSCILPIFGCTDPLANNYNPDANTDDGSCTYDPILIYGCTDPLANNYNLNANTDDGSCTYDPVLIYGCTDPEANNYNPDANTDDGSCTYDPILIYGCTDPEANNYNPNANMDDDSCTYDILGCTDANANNFNQNANVDDGSCTYDPEIIFGCTDPTAINFDSMANTNDGTCIYEIDICEEPDLHTFIPNAISPNNDGLNDVWKVVTQSDCWKIWKVQIYNRWGSLIWESEDPDAVWTASNSGSVYYVSDGIYVYTITGVAWNNKPIQKSGYISVFR
jgi:gliding motility-associated-like protein